ncbi:MAG: hypothetical protein HOY71_31035, partial [Nonomuraea sp.]|nr:hypothetical protein [Nonomuraea sp.]
ALAGARAHLADLRAAVHVPDPEPTPAAPESADQAPVPDPYTAALPEPQPAVPEASSPELQTTGPQTTEPHTTEPQPTEPQPAEPHPTEPPPAEVRAYLTAIKQATAAANHVEALTLAEELTRGVEARHGPGHPYTLNAYEVRAHLTASAGLFATAARQYAALAERLADAGDPADPGALSAADAAQTLWLRLGSTDAARNLGPGIVDLRRRVHGPGGSALSAARDHLSALAAGTA